MLQRFVHLPILVLGLTLAFSSVMAAQANPSVSAENLNIETLNFSSLAHAGGDAAMGISPSAFHGVGNSYSQAGFTFTATDNPWGPQTLGTWMDGSPNHPVGRRKATPLTAYYAGTKITATPITGSFDLISVDLAQWAVNQGGGAGSFPVTFHGMRGGREVVRQTFQVHRVPKSPLLSSYRFKGFTNLTSFYVIEEGTYATGYGFQLNNIVFRRNNASPAPPQGPNLAVNPTHFHCYQVEGASKTNRVSLRDQFQTAPEVLLGRPVMLCAPAQKNKEELKDTTTHLLCYQTVEGARPADRRVIVTNQFGEQVLQVGNSQLLCVPGLKRVPAMTGGGVCSKASAPQGDPVALVADTTAGPAPLTVTFTFCETKWSSHADVREWSLGPLPPAGASPRIQGPPPSTKTVVFPDKGTYNEKFCVWKTDGTEGCSDPAIAIVVH